MFPIETKKVFNLIYFLKLSELKMEAWQTVKDYISESYSLITNEAWQLGVDTKTGFGTLYTDIVSKWFRLRLIIINF